MVIYCREGSFEASPDTMRPPAPDPRRQRTRTALLRAGEALLAQRSIEAIPVDDLVRAAGVAKGSFFNHFSDKAAFAGAVAAEIRIRIEHRVGAVNAGRTSPAERLVRGVCAYVQYAREHPDETRALLQTLDRPAPPGHPLNAGLRADLEAGFAQGLFRAPSTEAAVLLVGGVGQVLLSSVLDGRRDGADDRRLAAETLSLLLSGLGLPSPTAHAVAVAAARDLISGAQVQQALAPAPQPEA